jgi:hypothetical protein
MQNGWLGIPYYQQFVEFPIHLIKVTGMAVTETKRSKHVDINSY